MIHAKRRQFLIAASTLLAAPLARAAQPSNKIYRVGAIFPFGTSSGSGQQYLAAFRETLAARGFIEGKNLKIDTRVAITRYLARFSAVDLLKLKPDAIFTLTTVATLGAQDATKSVPIVFAWVADPKVSGIVKDYARPGGNTTGVSNHYFALTIKRVELVRELVPDAKRVVVLSIGFDSMLLTAMRLAEPAAERLGLELERKSVSMGSWEHAVRDVAASGADAAIVQLPFSAFGMSMQAQETVNDAMRQRIPVIYSDSESVELGGLISYATNPTEDVRRGATYLARVLGGERPGGLPVDQATRFELVVNLKTAKAKGITFPPSIVLRADRVIE